MVVAAFGGNALLERTEKPDADIQESHIRQAVEALTPPARAHDLVLTHGNGPQVGMLPMESEHDPAGIWGGTSEDERCALRHRRTRQASTRPDAGFLPLVVDWTTAWPGRSRW